MTELERVVDRSTRLSPRSKVIYLDAVRNFLDFAGRDPKNWSGIKVEEWRDALVAAGRKPQTANLMLRGLRYASRRVSELARNDQLDFARGAERLRPVPSRPVKPLTTEEAVALIAACEGPSPVDLRDLAIVTLALRTGLRREGIASLTRVDVSADIRSVTATMKGGKRLRIPLDEETRSALHPWIEYLNAYTTYGPDKPVFVAFYRPTVSGTMTIRGRLTADGLAKALGERAKKAGIRKFHPHRLRHTFITMARQAGVPDWKIAAITGHATTLLRGGHGPDAIGAPMLDRYSHTGDEEAAGDLIPPMRKR